MLQGFWDFARDPNTSNLWLGMPELDFEAKFASKFKFTQINLSLGQYTLGNGVLQVLFYEKYLMNICLNIHKLNTKWINFIAENLHWKWVGNTIGLTLAEFLSNGLQEQGIQLLRVTSDKGWIGENNEFILVKPNHIFCSFYSDFDMKLGKIELTSPPYPNYEYAPINSAKI